VLENKLVFLPLQQHRIAGGSDVITPEFPQQVLFDLLVIVLRL
jgi:hypothetical protein